MCRNHLILCSFILVACAAAAFGELPSSDTIDVISVAAAESDSNDSSQLVNRVRRWGGRKGKQKN